MLKVLITPSSAPAAQDQSAYSSICAPTSLLTFRVCTKQVLHLLYSQQKGGGVEVSEASRLFHKHDKTRIKNKFLPAQSLHYNFCSAVIRNSPVLASLGSLPSPHLLQKISLEGWKITQGYFTPYYCTDTCHHMEGCINLIIFE